MTVPLASSLGPYSGAEDTGRTQQSSHWKPVIDSRLLSAQSLSPSGQSPPLLWGGLPGKRAITAHILFSRTGCQLPEVQLMAWARASFLYVVPFVGSFGGSYLGKTISEPHGAIALISYRSCLNKRLLLLEAVPIEQVQTRGVSSLKRNTGETVTM